MFNDLFECSMTFSICPWHFSDFPWLFRIPHDCFFCFSMCLWFCLKFPWLVRMSNDCFDVSANLSMIFGVSMTVSNFPWLVSNSPWIVSSATKGHFWCLKGPSIVHKDAARKMMQNWLSVYGVFLDFGIFAILRNLRICWIVGKCWDLFLFWIFGINVDQVSNEYS